MPKRVRHISNHTSIRPVNSDFLAALFAHLKFDQNGHSERLLRPDGLSADDESAMWVGFGRSELATSQVALYREWQDAGDQLRKTIQTIPGVPLDDFLSACAYQVPALEGWYGNAFLWDQRNVRVLDHATEALAEKTPLRWPIGNQVLFGHHFWSLSAAEQFYDDDQLRLVFLDTVDKERRKFEKLKLRHSGLAGAPIKSRRESIPEEVRMYVWRRDQGKCAKCGSTDRLEFDHIIPHSKGGSATERNIQLLCEVCNREKSDNI